MRIVFTQKSTNHISPPVTNESVDFTMLVFPATLFDHESAGLTSPGSAGPPRRPSTSCSKPGRRRPGRRKPGRNLVFTTCKGGMRMKMTNVVPGPDRLDVRAVVL